VVCPEWGSLAEPLIPRQLSRQTGKTGRPRKIEFCVPDIL